MSDQLSYWQQFDLPLNALLLLPCPFHFPSSLFIYCSVLQEKRTCHMSEKAHTCLLMMLAKENKQIMTNWGSLIYISTAWHKTICTEPREQRSLRLFYEKQHLTKLAVHSLLTYNCKRARANTASFRAFSKGENHRWRPETSTEIDWWLKLYNPRDSNSLLALRFPVTGMHGTSSPGQLGKP